MIPNIEYLDQQIVLLVNGVHTPWLDEFMWIISGKLTWIPLYLFLIYLIYKFNGWGITWKFVLMVIVAIALTDLTATYAFKEVFKRYRPSHHEHLGKLLHFYQMKPGEYYKGGQYGFVSSHAANFTALMVANLLLLRQHARWLIYPLIGCWLLISLSRIYLGVHYPTDILGGTLLGAVFGYLAYFSIKKIRTKSNKV
jgi:undecaprenyl-diphosphatase